MSLKSKIAVFNQVNKCFDHSEIEVPEPLGGEVIVRVVCCTICGSDIHTYSGRRKSPPECVLGHEIIGAIEHWGGESPPLDYWHAPLEIGQRVTWGLAVGCGSCFFCKNELSQKCTSLFKYGHEPAGLRGATGGLTEYCTLVPGTSIFPIADAIPDHVACPANCATATVAAALRIGGTVQSLDGCTVVVTGMGMLGLTASAMLREKNVRNVVAIDLDPARLTLARRFGATADCVHGGTTSSKIVQELTGGRGADFAFDFAGVTPAVQTCIDSLRVGGVAVLAGSVFPDAELPIAPEEIVRRMLTIRGIHNYGSEDLSRSLEFLEQYHNKYPFAELVEKSFCLDDAKDAFDYSLERRPVRVVIKPKPMQPDQSRVK